MSGCGGRGLPGAGHLQIHAIALPFYDDDVAKLLKVGQSLQLNELVGIDRHGLRDIAMRHALLAVAFCVGAGGIARADDPPGSRPNPTTRPGSRRISAARPAPT
jgi:hypothetical protein